MTDKPMPLPTPFTKPFWQALLAHRIDIQNCNACGHWTFFPRGHCPHCFERDLEWKTVSGAATLLTYTIARVPTMPEFADEMPQILAVVKLDEGVHMNTSLVGLTEDEIEIGMRLKPVFHDVMPGKTTLLKYTGIDKSVTLTSGNTDGAKSASNDDPFRKIDFQDIAAMKALVSDDYSDWSNTFTVNQDLINQFAALSGDDYWLHTDPLRAAKDSPFGTTIAHGALVQVLSNQLKIPLNWEITGYNNMINYGSDKIRFPQAVPVGSDIYARSRIKSAQKVKSGVQLTYEICTHVVGQERPSVINELVVLYM